MIILGSQKVQFPTKIAGYFSDTMPVFFISFIRGPHSIFNLLML